MQRSNLQPDFEISRRSFVITLALIRGIGAKRIVRILSRNDLVGRSCNSFSTLPEDVLREEYKLPPLISKNWNSHWSQAREEAKILESKLAKFKVDVVTAADVHFPKRIEDMDPQAPGVLFLYGNSKLLNAKTFAVLSSRNSQPEDLDQIERLTEAGVLAGEVLVSGHDTPEYQRSAVVPLRWGAPRILVLDAGLFSAMGEELTEEPFRAARLWRYKFDPLCDLVVSPCVPQVAYHANINRQRDRLIGALSDRIDFVQVAAGGNMEAIARSALKAHRSVRLHSNSPVSEILVNAGAERVSVS